MEDDANDGDDSMAEQVFLVRQWEKRCRKEKRGKGGPEDRG